MVDHERDRRILLIKREVKLPWKDLNLESVDIHQAKYRNHRLGKPLEELLITNMLQSKSLWTQLVHSKLAIQVQRMTLIFRHYLLLSNLKFQSGYHLVNKTSIIWEVLIQCVTRCKKRNAKKWMILLASSMRYEFQRSNLSSKLRHSHQLLIWGQLSTSKTNNHNSNSNSNLNSCANSCKMIKGNKISNNQLRQRYSIVTSSNSILHKKKLTTTWTSRKTRRSWRNWDSRILILMLNISINRHNKIHSQPSILNWIIPVNNHI